MQKGEQDILLWLVKSINPKVMVEIGVNYGLTAQAMLRSVRSIEQYIGVDVDADYEFEIEAQAKERPRDAGLFVDHDPRFRLVIRGKDKMPNHADVVFIDGDHGRNAVLQDSRWAAEVVGKNGLIVWHDYQNPTVEVTAALNELYAEGRKLTHVAGTWLVFECR
jgi:predicted O-methyltransferase YrrM